MSNKISNNELIPALVLPIESAIVLQAEKAQLDTKRAKAVSQSSFDGGKGVSLQDKIITNVDSFSSEPDLLFKVKASRPGRYEIHTHSATDDNGSLVMAKAKSKFESLFLMISIGNGRPTKRVVFTPWSKPESCKQTLGKFYFSGEIQDIKIWLPEGVLLDFLKINFYVPPEVPANALSYNPKIVPPNTHPRLWVNHDILPSIRFNLTEPEHLPHWANMQELASKQIECDFKEGEEIDFNHEIEDVAVAKAFVSLMSNDHKSGKEAIVLIRKYLASVEFGNILDITREIGMAIYAASLVYDWCYELMSKEERNSIKINLERIADDMEIGWPPFKQKIVNGHGNEAQVLRDLLCMSIAIYDENPIPYQYCSYRVLEELVPLRNFEYQSPRHNQGNSYGPYRFGWDMHAAWLFFRMSGKRIFNENITQVSKSWLYAQLPNENHLKDGDDSYKINIANRTLTSLLCYTFSNDPVLKYEFEKQGGLSEKPLLILLLNDPNLIATKDLNTLPLTLDTGPILGSMIARTGWHDENDESDVVVEMKGGGYHFGNHQHSDAGSFQIYYRGLQVVDLGQYLFYGTPYDFNFCKRSISHSMMLVFDPDEKFSRDVWNDGGTRFNQLNPTTPEQVMTDPNFANGFVKFSDFGPSPHRPSYNVFSVDLASAYSKKIRSYTRTFCFLNLDNTEHPAVLLIFDHITTSNPKFKKYWQVNTLKSPEVTDDGLILRNDDLGKSGKVELNMILPKAIDRELEIMSGNDICTVFGKTFIQPKQDGPEAFGHRIIFSPKNENCTDLFLTMLTIAPEDSTKLRHDFVETEFVYIFRVADRIVVLNKTDMFIDSRLNVEVCCAPYEKVQIVLIGLKPGSWECRNLKGDGLYHFQVVDKKNTAFFEVSNGEYIFQIE